VQGLKQAQLAFVIITEKDFSLITISSLGLGFVLRPNSIEQAVTFVPKKVASWNFLVSGGPYFFVLGCLAFVYHLLLLNVFLHFFFLSN
jgi:hypothetical protein